MSRIGQSSGAPLQIALSVDTGLNHVDQPSIKDSSSIRPSPSSGILALAINPRSMPSPARHVTFSGDIDKDIGLPPSSINHTRRSHNDAGGEKFVDGNYFFNRFDERREAQERQRAFDDFQRRRWRRYNHVHNDNDRLSTSLPVFQSNSQTQLRSPSRVHRSPQMKEFDGGMELEIPIRWRRPDDGHRSISADRLLQTTRPPPPPHICATEGRYHVGTGRFHQFQPIGSNQQRLSKSVSPKPVNDSLTKDVSTSVFNAPVSQSVLQPTINHESSGSLSRSLQRSVSLMDNIDQFALFEVSTSFLGWGESFMGTSWIDTIKQYKFVVLNRYEEVLFFGIEEDASLSNCNLGPHKSSFKVRILDANGQDFIQFRRLYPLKPSTKLSTLATKRKYRLEVSTSSGRVIGNVEKTFDSDSYYVLEDRSGQCLFVIQRSCICTCPLFWDYEFKVLIPGTDTEVGDISWSYLTAHEEHFNGTEISFPVELEATSKIMLLGVCFLLNFSRWQSRYLESVYKPRKRGPQTASHHSNNNNNNNSNNSNDNNDNRK